MNAISWIVRHCNVSLIVKSVYAHIKLLCNFCVCPTFILIVSERVIRKKWHYTRKKIIETKFII